jgi:dTDP-4-dehydrorhamnose reductase
MAFPSPFRAEDAAAFLPLLVAGLPGVPGFNAFLRFRARFPGRVFGIGPAHLPGLSTPDGPWGSGILPADVEDPDDLDRLFRAHRFRAVLDASGWCALKPCEHDRALARRLNVDAGVNLMRAAGRHGARLVRLSTDLVFDGRPRRAGGSLRLGGYREEDPVSPVTVYGSMMAEAEGLVLEGLPGAAVLRIPLPMGPSLNGRAGAIDWIESRFRAGRPATLYFDEVRSNLYVQDLGRALEAFLANGAAGLFHVGGSLPLSLYRIGQAVNRLGGYPPELLMGCLREAAGPVPPRAGDVSMDSSKARALLPADVLGPWPRLPEHVPGDPEWHGRRPRDGLASRDLPGTVGSHLYGYGWPEAGDHPLRLVPAQARRPRAPAAAEA